MSTLVHIVMWQLNGETADIRSAQALSVVHTLEAMRGKVPGLREMTVGANIKKGGECWDVALYTVFENAKALAAYKSHPLHDLVVQQLKSIKTARAEVDFLL